MGKFTINGDFNVHLTIDLLFDTVEQPPPSRMIPGEQHLAS